MDVNETLRQIRNLVVNIHNLHNTADFDGRLDSTVANLGSELADSVADLDDWLLAGGLYPDSW